MKNLKMAPNGLLAVFMAVLCCALADQPLDSGEILTDTVVPDNTESKKGEFFVIILKLTVID